MELFISERNRIRELESLITQLESEPKAVDRDVKQKGVPESEPTVAVEPIPWKGDLAEDLQNPVDRVARFYATEADGPPFPRKFLMV
jgi:hypothetical protein